MSDLHGEAVQADISSGAVGRQLLVEVPSLQLELDMVLDGLQQK